VRRKAILISTVVVAIAGLSTGIALATTGGGDDDAPLTGSTLDQATAAALEHTGGGAVVETEVGDDGAAYGVEIRLNDGSVVEIGLDENFKVIGQDPDEDGPNDEDGSGDS
jgi:uncharacterized membrane protein YkoI